MLLTLIAAEQTAENSSSALGLGLLIVFAAVGIGLFVLFITALISVLASRVLTGGGKVLWLLVVFAFPFLGPLCWFIWGRNRPTYRVP